MSFPRYPNYKGSPLEFASKLPSHWGITKLRRVMDFMTGWTPPTGRDDYYGGPNPWATIGDMNSRDLRVTEKQITDEAVRAAGMRPVPGGSLLFSFKLSIGQVAFAGRELYTNEAIASFLPGGELDLAFCYYAFPILVVANASENIYGAKLLNQQLIGDSCLLIPPPQEQRAIAAFLDQETAKIDRLIAEQKRLIELLKEKRQAAISQAVTKGLGVNPKLKTSGVEWIGDVPAHWKLRKLKHITAQVTVGIVVEPSKYYAPEGIPALRSLNVKPGEVTLESIVYISGEANELHAKSKLRAGDLVMVRSGQPGTTAVVPPSLAGANCIDLVIVRAPTEATSEYLCWYLNSESARNQVAAGSGGAIQQHFNVGMAENMVIPLPPAEEAASICNELSRQSATSDALITAAQDGIALLGERRSALISAAVTGQIDVRGLAEQKAA